MMNYLPRRRTVFVFFVASLGAAVLSAPASAHNPRPSVTINQACDSEWHGSTWTTIAFGAYKGSRPVLDDGTAKLQVRDVSGRSHGGQWLTFEMFGADHVPSEDDLLVSGGEGHLRFNEQAYGQQGGHAHAYRVLFSGAASQWVHADNELRCEP